MFEKGKLTMGKKPIENDLRLENDWGVVQSLEVEADTRAALLAALTIALIGHCEVTHYAERPFSQYDGEDDTPERAHGEKYLALCWHGSAEGAVPLGYPLTTPEEVTAFVEGWLKKRAVYVVGRTPDTDGSVEKGFRVTHAYSYDVARVAPRFIIYGK
jgi:hypothetical protein